MKYLFFLILLITSMVLSGQNESMVDFEKEAIKFNAEAKALIQKENSLAFDKLLSLGNFQNSQKLLKLSKISNQELEKENEMQILALVEFYSKNANIDSLLNLTRFYPDTIFQANRGYTEQFKMLISQLLDVKKRRASKLFYGIDGLNTNGPISANGLPFIINFENYWPFEVLEMEQNLQKNENRLRGISRKYVEEILTNQFQNELKLFSILNQQDSMSLSMQYIQEQRENLEANLLESKSKYFIFRNVVLVIFSILLIVGYFVRRKGKRMLVSLNQAILEEKKRSEELLHNILPAEVARELKVKGYASAHKYNNVSVLFSDFQGFSKVAEKLSPEELVAELDFCFKAFDNIIEKHRLQKIKTIGDAYMCVGGIYTKGHNHIRRMVIAALEIQSFLENLKRKREANGQSFFQARIGIHAGPIVAGVVGSKKFAYDVWGDTVNIAQQMEAHSVVGKVNVSGKIHELIKDQFTSTPRGKIIGKNLKEFDMFFIDEFIKL